VWVLSGKPYQYGKEEILKALAAMLQSPVFEFENRSCVYQALQRTQQGRGDFSDYLIGALSHQVGCRETISRAEG
jgi:predicted nucleic-acid-binding protein